MAIKAGLTLLEIIEQYVRRMMMGKGSGILKIPPKKDVNKFAKDLLKKFKEHGVSDSAVKNPRDVKIIWEQITNKEAQIMQNNMMDIVREGTEKFKTKKSADVHPFQGFKPKIVPKTPKPFPGWKPRVIQGGKSKKPITAEDIIKKGDWDPSGMKGGGSIDKALPKKSRDI